MDTNTCRHFNGVCGPGMRKDHIQCTVGQKIDDYKQHNGRMNEWGCINGNACEVKCPKFDPYTKDKCDKDAAYWEEHIQRTIRARKAVVERIAAGHGKSGAMMCPICLRGSLHYVRHDYNGHIHAKCETAGCVAWME